jgi:hypothetical protein
VPGHSRPRPACSVSAKPCTGEEALQPPSTSYGCVALEPDQLGGTDGVIFIGRVPPA